MKNYFSFYCEIQSFIIQVNSNTKVDIQLPVYSVSFQIIYGLLNGEKPQIQNGEQIPKKA